MRPLKKDFNTPRWVVLIIDILIVIACYTASNFIINSFKGDFETIDILRKIPIITFFYSVFFIIFGTYKGVIRQTSIVDAQNLFFSNFVAFGSLLVLSITQRNLFEDESIMLQEYRLSYAVLFIHSFVTTVLMIVARLSYKNLYFKYLRPLSKTKNVVIYGAGDSGIITFNTLKSDTNSNYNVINFIDDNKVKAGNKINGVSIKHSSELSLEFIKNNNIKEVVISIQNISQNCLLQISEDLSSLPVKLKIIPAVSDWMKGTYSAKQIKQLRIEDLLGRDSIKLNNPVVNHELENKTILITGAAGSIGSEIANQVAQKNFKKLILVDIAESALYDVQQAIKSIKKDDIEFVIANVRDFNRMKEIFVKYTPDYIYHAAAYKHVPLMEKYPFEAVITNVNGTKIMADLAHEFNVEKFVMVSTDKAVNPTNVMGATKRCAEIYVNCLNKYSNTNYIVTRFGNVLGSNGSVIPLFKRQLEEGGPLTVTHPDITRFFMTIPEACQLVLEAGTMGKGGEIFVFDMGKSMKIVDLAKRMIHLSGYKYPEEIDIKFVGLRPGEKIFEELLANDENTMKTHHEKIMIAKINYSKIEHSFENINTLCSFATENEIYKDNINLVKQIKNIVPEFKSQNSEYETLDDLVYEK